MSMDRRKFLKLAGVAAGTTAVASTGVCATVKSASGPASEAVGCLADTTLCIGCRQCEIACNTRNKLPKGDSSLADRTFSNKERRPTDIAFTVVNEYPGKPSPDQPHVKKTFAKVQCMHCLTPACVSACIVGAMTRASDGAVVYNPAICLGCRYCQIACPFEIPAYEFYDPIKPRVRKCEFCTDHSLGTGANPACAATCPTEALVFGKRPDLIALARERIKKRPDRYLEHIYGETEMGGTSWLYLVGRPPSELGMLDLADNAPPHLTEAIQHGIFKYGILPVVLYGLMGGIMWRNKRKEETGKTVRRQDDPPEATPGRPTGGAS